MRLYIFISILVFALLTSASRTVEAQQTIFNVPSAYVLDSGTIYFENDWYLRPWMTVSDKASVTSIRGVVGVGKNVELGINTGTYDLLHKNNPFIDAVVKWRPLHHEFGKTDLGAVDIYGGSHFGIGLHGDSAGKGRNLTYGAISIASPLIKTRIGIGPYFATSQVFGSSARGGVLTTFEQPIPGIDGLLLAADWFSGDGGYVTPGIIYTKKWFSLYAGYGFANIGRADDLITLEMGVTIPLKRVSAQN
jgi:hypothetical protein